MNRSGNASRDLQREAENTRYALRSSFYYRMHGTWSDLLKLLDSVHVVDWAIRSEWGISDAAWTRVEEAGEAPHHVFCHPQAIETEPRLVAYYRCLALLPQKGLQRLAVGTQSLEVGRGRLSRARATTIAKAVNSLISLLIDSDPNWTLEGARTAALLNLGSQVNGSWRNEIGNEGSRRVKELVVAFVLQHGLAGRIFLDDGSQISPDEVADEQRVRSVQLTNNYTVSFGSEPDIAIRDSRGTLLGTVEVKYGLDPAGALERYGAAKKSFESATHENARVTNVYLASCITPEVRRRMAEDRLVNREFNLTEVLHNAGKRQEVLNYIRRLVEL